MEAIEKLDTHQKALHINLDATTFGSFAEIGAGQEVVRWFLVVGGASGTVAKSISAYDKEVSDDLYGRGSRYVSRERLEAMLQSEWAQILNQLAKSRGSQTRFFSFVDTVSARNYAGTNEPHGWLGLRFQQQPGGQPSDILLHVNLRDATNLLQQEAIGILGVDLIHAAFYQSETMSSSLRAWRKISRIESKLTMWICVGPLSKLGTNARFWCTWCTQASLKQSVSHPTAHPFRRRKSSIEIL